MSAGVLLGVPYGSAETWAEASAKSRDRSGYRLWVCQTTILRRHRLMTEQAQPDWEASYTRDTPAAWTSAGRNRRLSGSLTRAC